MTYWKQIEGESVPNDQKLFSIYEQHTDIIAKGSRDVLFGHKVNLATGKSNLIIDCHIPKGNPSDRILFTPTLDRVIKNYGISPRDSSTDGGYASKENSNYCESKGVVNIVFNKVVGSLQNIATSLKMETISLKKEIRLVSHEYHGIDYLIIWDVATNYLPENKSEIDKIIDLEN